MNYPDASWNLARYFYGENGLEPDKKRFYAALEKASQDGSARASLELGKLAGKKDNAFWLRRAEVQNLSCFQNDVYEELMKYKK